uniref:Uncharacterized protein n=1 Tax=Heterorhabditis bacteriophora TaxID=37862 RepID=A0A1I7WV11_HETBA
MANFIQKYIKIHLYRPLHWWVSVHLEGRFRRLRFSLSYFS